VTIRGQKIFKRLKSYHFSGKMTLLERFARACRLFGLTVGAKEHDPHHQGETGDNAKSF
jgi:molybdopterin-guanine dinucleotide biosynthesis protein